MFRLLLGVGSCGQDGRALRSSGVPIGRGEVVKETAHRGAGKDARAFAAGQDALSANLRNGLTTFFAHDAQKARTLGRPLLGYFLWTSRESNSLPMDGQRNSTGT